MLSPLGEERCAVCCDREKDCDYGRVVALIVFRSCAERDSDYDDGNDVRDINSVVS